MSVRRGLRAIRRAEDGGALVQVAIAMPLLILLLSFVIDIGNWFVHKRHLQMRADAAALAAAGDFSYPCDDPPIVAQADAYSGTHNEALHGTPPGVTRLDDPSGPDSGRGVYMTLNKKWWPLQVGEGHPEDTTVVEDGPCKAFMVDVKLTETDVPWFFRIANVRFINAHARASLVKQSYTSRLFPIGAPDVDPKQVKAMFVDETNGEVISSTLLKRVDSGDDANPNATWSNIGMTDAPGPLSTRISKEKIGLRVALSDSTETAECGQPLVQCVDVGSANGGISRIRGWALGSGTGPVVKDVELTAGTCDAYFARIPGGTTQCTAGIKADVDFGADPASIGAKVFASRNGSKPTEIELKYDSADGRWKPLAGATIPFTAEGANPITMRWEKSKDLTGCTGQSCGGDFVGPIHSMFIGAELRTGAIQRAEINEVLNAETLEMGPGNSFRRCTDTFEDCVKQLAVTLEISGTFRDARSATDKAAEIPMRVIGGTSNNSSQSTALACRSALEGEPDNLPADLANGCSDRFTKNTGTTCPGNEQGLEALPQPWECIALAQGATPNAIAAGINKRILGAEKPAVCTHWNRWAEYWSPDSDNDGRDEFDADALKANGDPRLVQMVVVPKWTLLGGSGQNTLPIKRFAHFYITGWRGEGDGFANPCQTDTVHPDDPAREGAIVGHFVDYIDTIPAYETPTPCNPEEVQTCTITLTI